MPSLKYFFINIVGTLLRGFPLPAKTGLRKIGNPDRSSPVFLTCNYAVSVERVKKALEGMDCYLLVANSNGINVWCASTGGHLSNHSAVSVLKTSGIEQLVDHRRVIFPQLAAAGIEAGVVRKKTGWHVIWGPVHAKDIPRFTQILEDGHRKDANMRMVKFPLLHRLEMAVMWAFPFSLILALLTYIFWRQMLILTVAASWIVPLFVFITFPLYSGLLTGKKGKNHGFYGNYGSYGSYPGPSKEPHVGRPLSGKLGISKYTVLFNIGWVSLILWLVFMLGVLPYSLAAGTLSLSLLLRWGFVSLSMMLLVNIDLMGSTPVYKSGLHEERLLKVMLDRERCTGCGICVDVCPRNCFSIEGRKAVITGSERCVQCSACIVQCPEDALYFASPLGKVLMPDTIRMYKLNMMGSRLKKGA